MNGLQVTHFHSQSVVFLELGVKRHPIDVIPVPTGRRHPIQIHLETFGSHRRTSDHTVPMRRWYEAPRGVLHHRRTPITTPGNTCIHSHPIRRKAVDPGTLGNI